MPAALAAVRQNNWDRVPFLAEELNTQTLGIIGFGRLGKILLRYARAFDMQVLLHDIDDSAFTKESLAFRTNLDPLLAQADYVILQADYRESNRHFFGKAHFRKMKKGACFINTARGELVDEAALLEALQSGHLRGTLSQFRALVQRVLDVAADAHDGIAGGVDGERVQRVLAVVLQPFRLSIPGELLRARKMLTGDVCIQRAVAQCGR